MNHNLYINVNGSFYQANEKVLSMNNRAFKYGDALFESIRIINGIPCFLADHFSRLEKGLEVLKMPTSTTFMGDLENDIHQLILKNNIKKGGKIRLTVFREAEGLYAPEGEEKIAYAIEAIPLRENTYELDERGIVIDVYNKMKRHKNVLSSIKTTNSIPHVLAGIYKKEKNLDDCIVLNEQNRIVETISANIFLYKNNNLYTPAIEEGCINGVMRQQVLKTAKKMRINTHEGVVNGSMLLQADEFFLTNAIKGIVWVGSYREKRYFNKATKEILNQLNADLVAS